MRSKGRLVRGLARITDCGLADQNLQPAVRSPQSAIRLRDAPGRLIPQSNDPLSRDTQLVAQLRGGLLPDLEELLVRGDGARPVAELLVELSTREEAARVQGPARVRTKGEPEILSLDRFIDRERSTEIAQPRENL